MEKDLENELKISTHLTVENWWIGWVEITAEKEIGMVKSCLWGEKLTWMKKFLQEEKIVSFRDHDIFNSNREIVFS